MLSLLNHAIEEVDSKRNDYEDNDIDQYPVSDYSNDDDNDDLEGADDVDPQQDVPASSSSSMLTSVVLTDDFDECHSLIDSFCREQGFKIKISHTDKSKAKQPEVQGL